MSSESLDAKLFTFVRMRKDADHSSLDTNVNSKFGNASEMRMEYTTMALTNRCVRRHPNKSSLRSVMADGKVLHDARRILIFVAMKVVQEQHKPTELDAIDHDLGECVSDELGSFRIEFQREVNLIREIPRDYIASIELTSCLSSNTWLWPSRLRR